MRLLLRLLASVSAILSLTLALAGLAGAAPSGPAGPDDDPYASFTEMPPVDVAVLREGVDASGKWQQTVRLTIRAGGSLSDASQVAYGDAAHVDAVFAAAHRQNPRLTSPAMIPAGQQIDLTIDGSTVFVVEAVLHSANSVVVRFTNGVVSTLYQNPEGSLKRVIAFPDSKPTDLFVYPAATPIKVRPGGRIVDLIYARGESFGDVVGQVYGLTSFLAASDLTKQTGWDPARWSPPLGEARRVVTMAPSAYLQQPKTVSPIPNPDPIGQARQEAQLQARRTAGIHPVRLESFGTVYHVEVGDPNETASEVSTLIYGSPGHTAEVARAAGLQAPSPAGGGQATTFDPRLLGRAFDLTVDYIDESFVVSRHYDSNGQRATALVDGAVLTEYPPAQSGPIVVVRYPTGYKRVVYRPPKLLVTASQGLALFHTASDAALSPVEADTVARKFTADLLWAWSPGIPRASSDVADSLQLADNSEGPLLVALVAPPVPHTIVGRILDSLALRNPIVATLALVFAGYAAVLAVNLGRRSLERLQRARW